MYDGVIADHGFGQCFNAHLAKNTAKIYFGHAQGTRGVNFCNFSWNSEAESLHIAAQFKWCSGYESLPEGNAAVIGYTCWCQRTRNPACWGQAGEGMFE